MKTLFFKVANQYTLVWDAVTELEDGSPLPEGDDLPLYIVYKVKFGEDKSTKVEITRTINTMQLLTFTEEGKYLVGVEVVRTIDGEEVAKSVISWSDDPAVVLNGPFGVMYYLSYKTVIGLR